MSELTFEPFGKIGRLKRNCVITEKIDGTNAQIVFDEDGNCLVGSRKREIWPEGTDGREKGCDNFGFAGWVRENRDELFAFLGKGRHYGEWAGGSIQCGYGCPMKRFFLFNTARFDNQEIPRELFDLGLDSVPVLYNGEFTSDAVDDCMNLLMDKGSAFNNWFKPEGVIVYHQALRIYSKVTFDYDDGKWNA